MEQSKKIFTLELHFKPNRTKDNFTDIPLIALDKNSSNAFLVLDHESKLFGKGFVRILMSNKNIKTLKIYNNHSIPTEVWNNKEILNNISFFNLDSLRLDSNSIPIVHEYQRIKENYQITNSRLDLLRSVMSVKEYEIRNILLNTIKTKINTIASEISNFKREHEFLLKETMNQIKDNNISEALGSSYKHNDIFEHFIDQTIGNFLDVYREIYHTCKEVIDMYYSSNDYLGRAHLESLIKRFELLRKMHKTSREMVKRTLFLNDIKNEISILKKTRSEVYKTAQKRIKNIISWYKKAIKLQRNKVLYFQKNSQQYRYLAKQIAVKKYIIKTLKNNKRGIKYLTESNFDELKTYLDSRMSLFIANNLSNTTISQHKFSTKKINSIIKKEFYLDLNQYVETSLSNESMYHEEIKSLQNKKRRVKHKKMNVFGIENFDEEINYLKTEIDLSSAKIEWKKEIDRSEYKNTILNNTMLNNNCNQVIKIHQNLLYINTQWTIKFDEYIEKTNKNNKFEIDALHQIRESTYNLNKIYSSINFMFDYLELIRYLIFDKFDLSVKNIKHIDLFARLIEILNSVSFSTASLTKPITNISPISRLKMGLLSELMNGATTLFIADDITNSDYRLKNEFLRINKEFCAKSGITYTFITNNRDLILDNDFENLFVFYDNKLIEYGKTKDLFKQPLHPVFRRWLDNIPFKKQTKEDIENYAFSDLFEFSNDHFIVAPNSIIKRLSADELHQIQPMIETQEQDLTTINDLESYTDSTDTMIVNLDTTNLNKIDIDTQNITKEFMIYNENLDVSSFEINLTENEDAY
ncbi:hypothetical protein KQ878_02340 [Mycoplasma zalophidermidis]|uniref:ABC transporter ATP-binding protein n=1 Tax=Mycoplasma zalophidermidis TaxID=398174 RepID=A0ABS6DS40_9MOLU|nr:hypothetical protein [Mycoplasma zalophidermidis]MBU4689776.1 hypothetical protein [Mycoplasma zalophidermidis]MBU4693712.1 hypothetical protein [Mycoplasma zalophidermidis]